MIRIGDLNKLASRAIALVTLGIGLLLSGWVAHTIPQDEDISTVTATLIPARELIGELPALSNASNDFLVVQRFTESPSIYQPVTAPEPANDLIEFGCGTLRVSISSNGNIDLNSEEMGSVSDLSELRRRLVSLFNERVKKRAFLPGMADRLDLPMSKRIYATVVISPSAKTNFGDLTNVMQLANDVGANQIFLQLRRLHVNSSDSGGGSTSQNRPR